MNKGDEYVDITKELTVVEWFTGYGGNELGLRRVLPTMRPIAFCERESFVVANMVSKMEKGLMDPVPVWSDVTSFPIEPFKDRVGLFIASYPCQPFSHAGKRDGQNDDRHLWPSCRRFICGAHPGLVFLENVEGHVSLGLSTVLADLEEDGYTAAWGIFSASEVGAPHQRKRVFILAYRNVRESERNDTRGSQEERAGSSFGVSDRNSGVHGDGARVWPSRPGASQYGWEPPRVVGNASEPRTGDNIGGVRGMLKSSTEHDKHRGQTQPPLGGNADGSAAGLDFTGRTGLNDTELAEIHEWMVKGTNRTDELRMCGNGVVPQTAERAFKTLYSELHNRGRNITEEEI